jgi:hypothetical protein
MGKKGAFISLFCCSVWGSIPALPLPQPAKFYFAILFLTEDVYTLDDGSHVLNFVGSVF